MRRRADMRPMVPNREGAGASVGCRSKGHAIWFSNEINQLIFAERNMVGPGHAFTSSNGLSAAASLRLNEFEQCLQTEILAELQQLGTLRIVNAAA